jgi:hypothetical protein
MTKEERYFKRTVEHIHRVQMNMLTVVTKFDRELSLSDEQRRILMYRVMIHDQSKFSDIQTGPYIELTEYHNQRKVLGNKDYDYPTPEIKNKVEVAVRHHYQCENHHPERMKGLVMKMDSLEVIEVVCDLQAMAQEFNEGSCAGYFEVHASCNKVFRTGGKIK